ncbi:MAG: NAD(P)-dependent oxidoreductase [Candidatus Cloacimonetes bacterium]|nr:NAD(P)-dependent oxidoreductase [Candidatus Cloacimonadota bacterium]
MKQKVIVTGANGFVGCNLVRMLMSKGYDVTCLVRKTSNLSSLKNLSVRFEYANFNSIDSLKKSCNGQEYIFHLAAKVKEKSKKKYFEINLDGTINLLIAVKNLNIKKFIFLSSQAASGPSKSKTPKTEKETEIPVSYYGKSKLAAEEYIKKYARIPWTIIRPASVFGPFDKDFLTYFKLVQKGIAPLVGFETKFISMIFIDDMTNLIIKSAENPNSNLQTFFANDGNVYSWQDFISTLEKVMGKNAIRINIPVPFVYGLAFFNEITKYFRKNQTTINFQKVKEMKMKYWLCSSEKARRILNFTPEFSLEKGIAKTYKWYKEKQWL